MEKNVAMVALFAALIAALGLVPQIALASGIPITAQTLGVMLAGTVLGARRGAAAALLFLLLVALGIPLLSGGRGGLGVFVSPSAGFLVGWPIAAFVTGCIMEKWKSGSILAVAITASMTGGIAVMYVLGVAGIAIVLDKSPGESAALVLPFVPGDVLKAVIAGMLTSALARARPRSLLSRHDVNRS